MSIKSITIGNFKGIRDKVKIELKPITLLFGPNSGGKSTIIQALHYAREVMVRHNLDPNFTELGGKEIDLGGFENMVYAHDKKTRTISFRFDLDLKDKGLPQYFDPDFYRVSSDDDLEATNIFCWNIYPSDVSSAWVELEISWDQAADTFLVSRYEVGLNEQLIARVQASGDMNTPKIQYINFLHPLLTKNQEILREAFREIYGEEKGHTWSYERVHYFRDLVDEFAGEPEKWLDPKVFSPEEYSRLSEVAKRAKRYKVEWSREMVKFAEALKAGVPGEKEEREHYDKGLEDVSEKKFKELDKQYGVDTYEFYAAFAPCEFLFFCLDRLEIESITGDLNIRTDQRNALHDALPNFDDDFGLSMEMSTSEPDMEHWYSESLRSAISQIVIGPGRVLKDELDELHYIGPIRSRIPRNYEPNRSIENSNWANGIAAWDVIHKEDDRFIGQVDNWLSDRLKSGYRVTRKSYKEIDISGVDSGVSNSEKIMQQYNSAPTKTRLFLMDEKTGVEVQLPDVGTGISQILPVIVAALYFKEGIVAIEQPELHIHPALQVALGDLFIQQTKEHHQLKFILETHSEHLLLRMLRRIREATENELPNGARALFPEDLAVYFVENDENGVVISSVRVNQDGDFIDRWPHGFFDERVGELF